MQNFNYHLNRISRRNGVIMVLALIVFFILMRVVGLGHNYWLRGLNIIIVFATVGGAIKSFKNLSDGAYEEFFDLFKVGLRTSVIGIGLFAIFLIIYLGFIDPAFMDELQQFESFGGVISPISIAFLIFLEGMGSSFVCSYLAIQLLKSRTVES